MTSKRLDRPGSGRKAIDPLDARGARRAALDVLARRDHASADLRRKLIEKGYDAVVVGDLIDRLGAEKLVDDRRYVESYIAYHAARGQGPHKVRAALRRIGMSGPLVEQGLTDYADWLADLRKAREKKFGAQLPTHYADKQRQSRFLGQRGFTSGQIRMAMGFDMEFDLEP